MFNAWFVVFGIGVWTIFKTMFKVYYAIFFCAIFHRHVDVPLKTENQFSFSTIFLCNLSSTCQFSINHVTRNASENNNWNFDYDVSCELVDYKFDVLFISIRGSNWETLHNDFDIVQIIRMFAQMICYYKF